MSSKALWLIPVVLIAIVVVITVVSRNQRWTPDGFQYARMALQDAGLSAADALTRAEAFYIQKPIGQIARYREFLAVDIAHAPPAPGPIFRTRVLYPWLVSIVYRFRGLAAPTDVSLVAYLIGSLLIYWLLLALARPCVAATGAVLFAISPLILVLAESDLTDMLAVTLWIGVLASVLHYMQSRRPSWLVTFGLTTLLLVLTRQSIYLPFGAVAGAFVGARLRRDVEDIVRSRALAMVLGGITIIDVVWYAFMKGAGIAKELEIAHGLAVRGGSSTADEPLSAWYRRAVLGNIVMEIKHAILNILPVLALLGVALDIRRGEIAILIGAAIAGLAPLFLDPSTSALARVLEAPLYPVVLAGLAIGAERLLRKSPFSEAQTASP
jgi:hypothetical protein